MEEKEYVTVSVEIFGTKYSMRTDEDPEYIRALGALVDKQMREVSNATRSFSGNHIGVLAALDLADRYMKLKKEHDELMELLEEK